MDRRTDSFFIARPRLHSMQRGKNDSAAVSIGFLELCFAHFVCFWF